MTPAEEIDRYFTEQIVGEIEVIEMGPAAGMQAWSERGVWIERLGAEARLMDLSARSLWAKDPVAALAGRPIGLAALRRMRMRVAAAGLVAWSVALYGAFAWLHA